MSSFRRRTQQPHSRPAPVAAQTSRSEEQPLRTLAATLRSLTRRHWHTITPHLLYGAIWKLLSLT